MNNDENENLVQAEPEKFLRVRFYTGSERLYSGDEYMYTTLLSQLKGFYDLLTVARKDLGIIKLTKCPEPPSVEKIVKLLPKEWEKGRHLEKYALKIANRYKISSDDWSLSFQLAIITNILFVPIKAIPVGVYIPKRLGEKVAFTDPFSTPEVTRYPALFFRRQMSINEITKFLRSEGVLSTIMQKLPRSFSVQTKENTTFWGNIIWIMRHKDGIKAWKEIVDKIEKFGGPVLDETTARNIYIRYKGYLNKIDKP